MFKLIIVLIVVSAIFAQNPYQVYRRYHSDYYRQPIHDFFNDPIWGGRSQSAASTHNNNNKLANSLKMNSTLLAVLFFAFFLVVTVESAVISRSRRAVEDYYYGNGVVHNVVNDNLIGGPTSLGWAQVPHVLSPMFSPVFGR
ncbi:unnamed protein product [Caenorhabditis bovis]|uniref:Nematode cuticle collagen N-terminal domain-containing protein n=1 Tax=Caenorhabditis bovis TaxID=2654633 RepID=A0A8S1EUT3_9PELO|nr:unnamed protein product [Caenorhabditis bovis]